MSRLRLVAPLSRRSSRASGGQTPFGRTITTTSRQKP